VRAYATNTSGTAYGSDLQFTTTAPPTLGVTPANQSVTGSSGTTSFSVTSNSSWTTGSDQTWCTVTPSGTGNGTIVATYTANSSLSSRMATITITVAGLTPVTVTVTQAGTPPEFLLTVKNVLQTSPTKLEFDVYLLDNNPAESFELASFQLGWLFSSDIYNGGTITMTYSNAGSGLIPSQQLTGAPSVVASVAGYPGQSLIRQAGKVPPGAGSGTIISQVLPGTLLTHYTMTNTMPFTANSLLNLVFLPSTALTPLYATRVAQYIGLINTQLTVTPGYNAIIEQPALILNPPPVINVAPSNRDVTSGSGNTTFLVTSNAGWSATSNQAWCTVTPSGFGNGTITAVYNENTTSVSRVAEITIAVTGLSPTIVTVTQEAAANRSLNLSLLLQGLYNGSGTMRAAMDQFGEHWGSGIADNITIELHNSSNYSSVVYTVSNVNLNTNGTASLTIPSVYSGSYYITVKHRNSIETVSSVPVSFSGSSVAYNFNIDTKAFGNNLGLTLDGWWVIYGGDVSQDGFIDTADMTPVDNDSFNYLSGYLSSDTNGDGVIDTGDMTIVDNNAANYVATAHP
jgi:hypothetical protein